MVTVAIQTLVHHGLLRWYSNDDYSFIQLIAAETFLAGCALQSLVCAGKKHRRFFPFDRRISSYAKRYNLLTLF